MVYPLTSAEPVELNVTDAGVVPAAEAVVVWAPTVPPSVRVTLAVPAADVPRWPPRPSLRPWRRPSSR